MKSRYIDDGGVENIAVAIIKQTKKDFIKGGKVIYKIFKRIPTEKELLNDKLHVGLLNNESIRWMYNAWGFVINDPYQFFGDVREESVIKSWTREIMDDYYRSLYLKGADILRSKHAPKKLHLLPNEKLKELIDNEDVLKNFIEARDYILGSMDGQKIVKEWNISAIERARHPSAAKTKIRDSEYVQKRMKKREENIEKAKEMFEDGMFLKEIAAELGVTLQSVRSYISS